MGPQGGLALTTQTRRGTSMQATRRSFVRGAATGIAAAGVAGAAGYSTYAHAAEAAAYTFADTVAWNAEYDVVVCGFGAAGGTAAIYAADAGARVLLVDVAPEGEEGGNSRMAAQMACSALDADKAFEYYNDGLSWHFDMDQELLKTYAQGEYEIPDILEYLGDAKDTQWQLDPGKSVTPEYPEYEAGQTIYMSFVHQGMFDSALWKLVRSNVLDRADAIDVWYDSPVKHLVQDPQTKTIVGAQIDKDGEELLVRAKNGVVLACGGFENNTAMIQNYLGAARLTPFGTLHNNGDGVRIGIEVGADLTHMSAYESIGILAGNAWAADEGGRLKFEFTPKDGGGVSNHSLESGEYGKGSIVLVGDDGSRFIDENANTRHGHVYSCGVWRMPIANWAPHIVFDQAEYDELQGAGCFKDGREEKVVSADTPEELAEAIGADPEILARTISDFNFFVEQGRDYQFNRDPASMRAFDGKKYYAAQFAPGILNTQGGPRRNASAEVVTPEGSPIPHLYSAGELGGITAFQYNSGGNLAECLIFGRIAGTNAAAEKDALAAYAPAEKVDADIKYVPGQESDEPQQPVEAQLGANEYLGSSTAGMGDEIDVKVTYVDGKITAIDILRENETPEYGGRYIQGLADAMVEAGSTDVDGITGCTLTTSALMLAVQDAISKAK